jgi:hypothetical protein
MKFSNWANWKLLLTGCFFFGKPTFMDLDILSQRFGELPFCGGIFFYEVFLPDVPVETSLIRVYQVARPLNTEHLLWPMGTSLQNIGRSTG